MQNLFSNTAWLYDLDNRDNLTSDIPFYIDYAKKQDGEILELGCGTGRVAISLAHEGFAVTGLDKSSRMLDVFKEKLESSPELKDKITLVHGDMSDFCIDAKFSLIISPFRAFQALTDDRDIQNSLKCIQQHLTDDGLFIVNVFKPYPAIDQSWCYPETVQWELLDENTENYVVKKHWGDKIDTDNQIMYPHFAYEITDKNGNITRHTDDLKLKYYYEPQLCNLLESSGFEILEKFGWYDKTTVEQAQRELIFVCNKKYDRRKNNENH